jgi:phosphopantetheinyl transferase
MPLILLEKKKDKFSFAVWQVKEDLSFFLNRFSLCENEKEEIKNFNNNRKLEWIASRYLLYKLDSKKKKRSCTIKDENGKPHLKDSKYHISLSHSGEYVAAVISKQKIGIDIQKISKKVGKIKKRFLSSAELKECADDMIKMNRFWTAKEALYKADGKKGLAFIENIKVKPFKKNDKTFSKSKGLIIINNEKKKYSLLSKRIKNSILTIALEKHRK